MISSNDLRRGTVIEMDGDLFMVTWSQHHKPGKGQAVVRSKLKSLSKGSVLERTFRAGEKLQEVTIEKSTAQYLYKEDNKFIFMDVNTFEQVGVPESIIGDDIKFLLENMEVTLDWYNGDVISVTLPNFVQVKITYTEPGLKGDTVSSTTKKAEIETGFTVLVPLFINNDDVIKVDTRTGDYIERV